MNTVKVYLKNTQEVKVTSRFIYNVSVYKIWKNGASLIEEKYYSSSEPLKLNKISKILHKENYLIQRFVDLIGATEEYLINKGYKLKKV